ncbi:MAG: 30S ribosomal protein S15 [Candidatus Micrarchaeota archaeon]|nr:30S ribosomal protein S15 [Candidatus Micrarchaeota archaeon]
MARLHSRKHGKSGTKTPKAKVTPKWVDADKAQVQDFIVKSVKEGMPLAKVGIIIRDKFLVPSIRPFLGMSLSAFVKKENVLPEYPEDMLNLIKKAVRLRGHLKTSKKDVHNKVKLLHIESKINRLVKYYTASGRLPQSWKYNSETAALLVK